MKLSQPIHCDGRSIRSAAILVEVLVAVLLLGLVLLALYGSFSSGFAVVKLAREDLRGHKS